MSQFVYPVSKLARSVLILATRRFRPFLQSVECDRGTRPRFILQLER